MGRGLVVVAVCWIGCSEPVLDEPVRRLGPDAITAFDVALPLDIGEGGPSDGPGVPDGGPFDGPGSPDGGVVPDGGPFDGPGAPDGGMVPDGGPFDGGIPDGGGVPDGGGFDGGMPDGGGVPDGGGFDGGIPDGGMPDGGMPDGGGGPSITVAPASLSATVPVGQTSGSLPLTITNHGGAPLTYALTFHHPAWTAPGSPCLAPAQCTIAPGGSNVVDVRFTPPSHGAHDSFVTIDSNAGMPTVNLAGTGVGGVLVVTDPASFAIDFGTIARGQLQTRAVELRNAGNAGITVDVAAPGAPFGVANAPVTLAPGQIATFDATCQSATARPVTEAAIAIGSSAYSANTSAIAVRCAVADTQLQVAPLPLDFMEVRKGTGTRELAVAIRNPGAVAATISAIRLTQAPGELALDGSPTAVIPPGSEIARTLRLATTRDLELTGTTLEIDVDGQQLAYPVTGKVVTPEVHVTPAELDLGTACIGTPITGTVMMTNTGTARLAMETPELDGGFTATYQSPTSYPAPLLAGTTALLGVSADPSAAGAFDGRLRWQVDAPGAPFEIPLHVEYIDVGTAVSPARLDFGLVEVGAVSFRSTVVLQNCNSSPVALTVDGIHVRQGPITAWDVQPRYDQRTLAPHETMTITAAFAPTRGGRHTAVIKIDIDGLSHFVELTAMATGYTPDRTSFYACASGPDAPAAGWPIGAALAVLVLRRRRRTCS